MTRMRLQCPECGFEVLADDINLSKLVAKCRQCNAVFSFADKIPAAVPGVVHQSPLLLKPPQMTVEDFGGEWRVSWRWFNWSYVPMAGFCVFWDGFLIIWYTMAFTDKHSPLIMKLFPIGHLAVGLYLTYSVLTGFFNRTVVKIAGNDVTIRHYPLPWRGNRTLPANQIKQFYCEKSSRNYSRSNNSGPTYQLCATFGEGKILRLLGGFRYLGEPKFLELQMEKRLRIAPQAVVGEAHD